MCILCELEIQKKANSEQHIHISMAESKKWTCAHQIMARYALIFKGICTDEHLKKEPPFSILAGLVRLCDAAGRFASVCLADRDCSERLLLPHMAVLDGLELDDFVLKLKSFAWKASALRDLNCSFENDRVSAIIKLAVGIVLLADQAKSLVTVSSQDTKKNELCSTFDVASHVRNCILKADQKTQLSALCAALAHFNWNVTLSGCLKGVIV